MSNELNEKAQSLLSSLTEKDNSDLNDDEIKDYATELYSLFIESGALSLPSGNDDMKDILIKSVMDNLLKEREKNKELEAKLKEKKEYRTKAKAGEIVTTYPQALPIPTLSTYDNAMSLNAEGNAYLTPLPSLAGLKFKDGKMFFDGNTLPIGEAQLQNMKTKESIKNIDLPLLRTFYAIILSETHKANKQLGIITLFVPEFAEYLGRKNLTEERIEELVAQVQQFHNIVGLVKTPYGDSIFPVFNFEGYDKKKNTISFYSPYMNHVISTIIQESIQKDKKGKPKLKKNKQPFCLPNHSYAIKSEIVKERNKIAVENVSIIVKTIEQAGGNGAHISAQTIIDRNPQLKEAYENHSNQRLFLQRCFKKTWELLRTQTRLEEMYKNIELPDPNDPANIPTPTTLQTTIFVIKHDGKKKDKTASNL